MLPKQLVAASLKPLVLTLIGDGDVYGYELFQRIRDVSDGRIEWTASRLYPLLHQMENEGLVEAIWQESESGPARKYYRLTAHGRRALERTKRDWLEINGILAKLWGPELNLKLNPAG